jgi:hypothetical protein
VVADDVKEELMYSKIVGEFGMKGGGEEVALADEGGVGRMTGDGAGGEGFDVGAEAADARGADEDLFERTTGEGGFGEEDGGVILAAVGVALDGDVEDTEGALGGVFYVAGEQDAAGAGAEDGFSTDEGVEGVVEAGALEVPEEGGGLAAGKDEGVERGELVGFANEDGVRAEESEALGVDVEGTLESENADGGSRGHGCDSLPKV